MGRNILEMETYEIINFLRFERKCLIHQTFDKEETENNFDISMCDKEWSDFIKHSYEHVAIWYLIEETLESWEEYKSNSPKDCIY